MARYDLRNISPEKRFDLTTLSPEQKSINARKGNEARKKLHPGPQRKKDLTGERLRLIEETTDRIKNILASKDMRYKEFAEALDMTPGHITHLMSGTRNMTLMTLADIGESLGYRFTVVASPMSEDEK